MVDDENEICGKCRQVACGVGTEKFWRLSPTAMLLETDGDERRRRRCYLRRWPARITVGRCISPSSGELCICSASSRRRPASTVCQCRFTHLQCN